MLQGPVELTDDNLAAGCNYGAEIIFCVLSLHALL